MTWASSIVTFTGFVLLIHSGYSAHEHSAITSALNAHALGTHPIARALPIDIRLETILATLLICLGFVLGSEKLHPIRWQVWAGKIEREGRAGYIDGSGQVDRDFRGSPFSLLETRPGFVDIRRQRHEFAVWARDKNVE